MTHNCIFCDSALLEQSYSYLDNYHCLKCSNDDLQVSFTYNDYTNQIIWTTFYIYPYKMWIAHIGNNGLFLYMEHKIILDLMKAPKINPNNAKHYLDKFLNLKSFS